MNRSITKLALCTLFIVYFISIFASHSVALEPKLLWGKKFSFKIYDAELAKKSGDIVVSSKDARRIICLNKDGSTRFSWGPRIDRIPFNVDISSNGDIVVFDSEWPQRYAQEKKIDINKYGSDGRIHYVDKTGKQRWDIKLEGGRSTISDDGSMLAVFPGLGHGGHLQIFDGNKKMLWKWNAEDTEFLNVKFSPDGNYLVAATPNLHLFRANGEHLWSNGLAEEVSIGQNAEFISAISSDAESSVYDKQGTIKIKAKGIVAPDSSKVAVVETEKIAFLKLPSLETINSYPISVLITNNNIGEIVKVSLSLDGRYIVAAGSRAGSISNLFVIDIVSNHLWETRVADNLSGVFITDDGKYALIVGGMNHILYYQIY